MKNRILTIGALLLMAGSSFAWDSFGHMAVAYVAYQKLTPDKQQRATELLKLNPQYQTWLSWMPYGTSTTDRDMMVFMLAAAWPDEIKGLPQHPPPINPRTGQSYAADGTDNGDLAEASPNPSANQGYDDNSMHKYWHFVDTPFSSDNTPLPPIPTPNAQDRIALFRSVLASDASDDLKSYDLAWLLHLVGDVHQPLHCATRVSKNDPSGDKGGNKVKVGNTELHAVWDQILGTGADSAILLKVVTFAKSLPPANPVPAADTNEINWVQESFHIAETNAYVPPVGDGDGPFTLTLAYRKNAEDIAKERVALAGSRLGTLLEANLK